MAQPAEAPARGKAVLTWDRQHPVMRNVALDSILFAGFEALELPTGATALAFGPEGPIIAAHRSRGARHIVIGFELRNSNWAVHVSFAVFLQNVLEYFSLGLSGAQGVVHRPGEPVSVRSAVDAREIIIDGPGARGRVAVAPGAPVTLQPFERCGMYELQGVSDLHEVIAVSMLSDVESDIRPRPSIAVAAADQSRTRADSLGLQSLWPWLPGAAFAALVLEWLAYCRRARGM
jgi:hypothetical protein